ncbi:hypothetical protein JCM14722_29780 [Pseudodesulfovibrio portus]|jgi:integrase|uniref:Tyr recombinase domain-containing protein n=2 Tax=Pseudodesulfovibrio portus TaxID=231439 RepID=A0ABM8AVA4_9BACT|nr:hypothetical protein JCM14722_29780 [Pseudodesulfovibrio portus]
MQPQTVEEKKRHIKKFAKYVAKSYPPEQLLVEQVTIELARNFIAHIQKAKTNKTANRYLRNLKACWNWNIKQGENIGNPFSKIEKYPEEVYVKKVPSTQDVVSVIMAADRFQADFLQLLLQTAARPGEIRKLKWEDVFFDRKMIRLWTRKRKGGGMTPRPALMTPTMREILDRRWKDRKNSPWVFTDPATGDRYERSAKELREMTRRLCDKAGVPYFDMYSLRHYVSQRVIDSGKANPVDIQKLLGHQRLTTTDNYIRSLVPDMQHLNGILESLLDEGLAEKSKPTAASGRTKIQ